LFVGSAATSGLHRGDRLVELARVDVHLLRAAGCARCLRIELEALPERLDRGVELAGLPLVLRLEADRAGRCAVLRDRLLPAASAALP
jgi:hypothetical protein